MRSSPNYEPESRTWNSTEKYSWKLRMNAPVSCCNVGLSGRNSATPAISCSREDPSVNRVARARTSRLQVIGIEPCCRKLRRTRRWALPTIFRPPPAIEPHDGLHFPGPFDFVQKRRVNSHIAAAVNRAVDD